MVKSARVPASMAAMFEDAARQVERQFAQLERRPDQGTVHVGGERYLMIRAESFYLAFMDTLQETMGQEAAARLLYTAARAIGRRDSDTFSGRMGLAPGVERLPSGPVHFAHAGFAFVHILDSSDPVAGDGLFLHYEHPNTFETEVVRASGRAARDCACHFSAGYSSGWVSAAFGADVHARELLCVARGDAHCEFIMAPQHRLDAHEKSVRASWVTLL